MTLDLKNHFAAAFAALASAAVLISSSIGPAFNNAGSLVI